MLLPLSRNSEYSREEQKREWKRREESSQLPWCPEQEWRRLLEFAKRMVSRSFLCLMCVVLSWRIGRVNSIAQLPSLLSYFSSCLSFFLSCKLFHLSHFLAEKDFLTSNLQRKSKRKRKAPAVHDNPKVGGGTKSVKVFYTIYNLSYMRVCRLLAHQ